MSSVATLHLSVRPGHTKMTNEELQLHLQARRGGHIHRDKSKTIARKQKYRN